MAVLIRHDVRARTWLYLGCWAVVCGLLILVERWTTGLGVIIEATPQVSGIFLWRSFFSALASLLFVAAVWLAAAEGAPIPLRPSRLVDAIGRYVVFPVAVAVVIVFVVDPPLFARLAMEDAAIEMLSALFWLMVAVMLSLKLVDIRNARIDRKAIVYLYLLALVAVSFVIAMEEISWGHRLFHPEFANQFESNEQQEINLHNFATRRFENAYYFGTFVFLIAAPFVRAHTRFFDVVPRVPALLPSTAVMVAATSFIPFNYDMWNMFHAQFEFFTTMFILASSILLGSRLGRGTGVDRRYLSVALAFVILVQAGFIAFGDRLVRVYDPTEYKEFFMPLCMLLYAVELWRRDLSE